MNNFVNTGMNLTETENGAMRYKTTNDPFLDQFAILSTYKKPRLYVEIEYDMQKLWKADPQKALKFILYIRMITRSTNIIEMDDVDGFKKTDEAQIGAGLRYEGIMRMYWLAVNHPNIFNKNLSIFVSGGSVRDLFLLMEYDFTLNKGERKLNWDMIITYIHSIFMLSYFSQNNQSIVDLVCKYMPRVEKNKASTTKKKAKYAIQKALMNYFSWDLKEYRMFKSGNNSNHIWQQQISRREFNEIEFSKIHGRALNSLVNSKFLENSGLTDKYVEWLETTNKLKYTGFAHELFKVKFPLKEYQKVTINKQFMTLVDKAKSESNVNLMVVRDTSGSMGQAIDNNMTAFDIAKAIALYFSYFLKGKFQDTYIEFNCEAMMHKWIGKTPVERWMNDNSGFIGSTNFMSVIDLFTKIKNSGVTESDFPEGIICISDTEFNPAELNDTNVNQARVRLKRAGFSDEYVKNFKIILWNLASKNYESNNAVAENTFFFSGYDAAVIKFLFTGEMQNEADENAKVTVKNNSELIEKALDQQLLNMLSL